MFAFVTTHNDASPKHAYIGFATREAAQNHFETERPDILAWHCQYEIVKGSALDELLYDVEWFIRELGDSVVGVENLDQHWRLRRDALMNTLINTVGTRRERQR